MNDWQRRSTEYYPSRFRAYRWKLWKYWRKPDLRRVTITQTPHGYKTGDVITWTVEEPKETE